MQTSGGMTRRDGAVDIAYKKQNVLASSDKTPNMSGKRNGSRRKLLLRHGLADGHWLTRGDGLLSLLLVPVVVRRPRKCLYPVEARAAVRVTSGVPSIRDFSED